MNAESLSPDEVAAAHHAAAVLTPLIDFLLNRSVPAGWRDATLRALLRQAPMLLGEIHRHATQTSTDAAAPTLPPPLTILESKGPEQREGMMLLKQLIDWIGHIDRTPDAKRVLLHHLVTVGRSIEVANSATPSESTEPQPSPRTH